MSQIDRLLSWRRKHPEEFERRKSEGLRRSAKVQRNIRLLRDPKIVAKRLEVRGRNPHSAAGPEHGCAKMWLLRDPTGTAHKVKNLAHFIRQHPDFFDESELVWRKTTCLAYSGLSSLRPTNRRPELTWKGWTWAATYAQATEPSHDILQRTI